MNNEVISTYTVIDVETPNCRNDSICSIALVCVQNNKIISKEYYLVNPEDSFDPINMRIHNISKAMVIDKPTFPTIWEKISKHFTNGIIVAHNASFDLNVISKALKNHKMNIPDFSYICTLKLSRRTFDFNKYSLDNICSLLEIELDEHHNALCDAISCQKIYDCLNSKNLITKSNVEIYHLNDEYIKEAERPILVKSLNSLYGIVKGIDSDGIIKESELQLIEKWIYEYEKYTDAFPYSLINLKIKAFLSDRVITEKEKVELINISQMFIQPEAFSKATLSMQILKGIIEGISCDDEIVLLELDCLNQWMVGNMHLKGNYPFDIIFSTINKVIEDKTISYNENKELIELFRKFLNPIEVKNDTFITLLEKTVCLSGNFINGTKDEIGELIINNGGVISSSLTKKTNILVVGGEGSKDWSYGNFGTKVKKAMELKSKGIDIEIFGEEDFLNLINRTDSSNILRIETA